MARKRIFRRLAETVRNVFRPEPPSRPEPEPPSREPTREFRDGGTGRYRSQYRETWDYTVTERDISDMTERTGYSENEEFQFHFEILRSLDPEADDETLQEMWQDYLMAFVSDGMTHDTFFETWYIDPRDFDWQMWRDAMGYSHRK